MAFLRTTKTTVAIVAAAAIPAIPFALSSSYSPCPKFANFKTIHKNPSLSLSCNSLPLKSINIVKTFATSSSVVEMDQNPQIQNGAVLPELLTEFMVDMSCEGCVKSVKKKLQIVDGVKNVDVDLSNQVVRVLGTSPVKNLTEALEQTGRKARLIGQGIPQDFLVSAVVAEFKGPAIYGVVRIAQVNMELARIEANFSGLPPGKLGWSINEYGDLTRGAASTGDVFNPTKHGKEPLGDLGTLDVDEKGEAFFSGVKENLRVGELTGRSVVVYGTEDKSDEGIAAAVVARSAGVGENYKKLCTCDGTTIWEATNADFVTSKV